MRLRLIPRDLGFYPLYAEQAAIAAEAARVLEADLREFSDPVAASTALQTLEHRGDDTNHAVLARLEATFVTPFGRQAMLQLTSRLDDIIDLAEKAGDLLVLYHVETPPAGAAEQASVLVTTCDVIVEAIATLDRPKELRPFPDRIHQLEKHADAVWRRNVRGLFDRPTAPRDVLAGEDIYDALEDVIDAADGVGRILEELATTPISPW